MRKLCVSISILLLYIHVSFSQNCGCDYIVPVEELLFDGAAVAPGEVICLKSGTRSRLKIKNLNGTPDNPVLIQNCGGDVFINAPFNPFGITVENSTCFQLTGSGGGSEFGIQISGTAGSGIIISDRSNHFEIDHIQIENTSGPALICRNEPNCDYTTNEGYFLLQDCALHHLNINSCGEGILIGHPDFRTGVVDSSCGALFPHAVNNLVIEDSRIANVYVGNGIELYGCSGQLRRNHIHDIEGSGVVLGTEANIIMSRNKVLRTQAHGVKGEGIGEYDFTNNLFVSNGVAGTGAVWLEFYIALGGDEENRLNFLHNTVVKTGDASLTIENVENASEACFIQNNILCEASEVRTADFEFMPHLYVAPSDFLHIDHNSFSDDRSNLFFVDPVAENFQLTHASPAINIGTESILEEDLIESPRNLGGTPDAGAFEYVPEPRACFGAVPLVGLYVDDFKNILGDELAETQLLEYAQANGFNYLLLYNLAYIHTHLYDLTDPAEAIVLADFVERAKRDYGIVQMGAVGEKDASFDKIETFNTLFGESWFQQFDVLNLEFEFWTDPGSTVFSYYCDTYLIPGGYPCTNTGAYNFYRNQLELIDARAHGMGIISEIYLGYMSDPEATELGERCDRILLHHYRTSDVYGDGRSIYNYHTYRIRAIALSGRKPAVMPIFSSRSYHMGSWLESHSLHQPMDTWLHGTEAYDDDDSEGVQDLPIAGFQWYRYTSFLDPAPEFEAPQRAVQTSGNSERLVKVAKNDAKNYVCILSGEPDVTNAGIYDLRGQLVQEFVITPGDSIIDLNTLPKGIYIVKINSGQQVLETVKVSDF